MQKNTVMFVVFSTLFLMGWYMLFQPKPINQKLNQPTTSTTIDNKSEVQQTKIGALVQKESIKNNAQAIDDKQIEEQEIVIETEKYKAVFSNKGAGIKNWFIKEKNGTLVDLVLPDSSPVMSNFPGSVYKITESSKK